MCDPVTAIAAAGAALSAVGTGVSYVQGQNAASAARSAQEQAMETQNTGFEQRMAADRAQTSAEAAANQASEQRLAQIQSDQQAAQEQAITARGQAIQGINTQEQQIADKANTTVGNAVQSANGPALADAQAARVDQQQAMNAPVQANIQASNPLGAASTGRVADAMSKGQTGAASYVKNYGDTLAKLSSYNEPIETANNAATTLGTNLMPIGAADQLLKTGAAATILPNTVAYQQAGAYGAGQRQASDLAAQEGITLADAQAKAATDQANLQQGDQDAIIQGKLSLAQQKAAQGAALGAGLTSLGNAGLQVAGSAGAFKGILPTTTKKIT